MFDKINKPSFHKYTLLYTVTHHIATSGLSVLNLPRRPAPEKLNMAKAEFEQIMELGIICPYNLRWASPLHQVTRSAGTLFAFGDYWILISATKPDRHPISHIHDITAIICYIAIRIH